MAHYDFSTLSATDLEELVCDLLNAKESATGSGVQFKTFKQGKDKGIDFRYSTNHNDNEIVGQVKHYYHSGFQRMIADLRKLEVQKVNKLAPTRYIFATSLELSVAETEQIRDIFIPHLKSLDDIYGRHDLNKLLETYPVVLNNHFKLWFSSAAVMQKVLDIDNKDHLSIFQENRLKQRMRLYVETPSFHRARRILADDHYVIITGEPGVGKTTTADLLVCEWLQQDYSLIYEFSDFQKANKKIDNSNIKQLIYFDDFLGHTRVEIHQARMAERSLLELIERVSTLENKKLVLTTRTFLLNAAMMESERLKRVNAKARESTIQLSDYTTATKLQLLHNHIDESNLDPQKIEKLRKKHIQQFIVTHPNFTPRSVEFITQNTNVIELPAEEFEHFIIENFNKPDEIWRHAYEQQIDDLDRILLNTFISFGDAVRLEELKEAFEKRLAFEAASNNRVIPQAAFTTAFRRLNRGFIIEYVNVPGWWTSVNHSLTDFLIGYLRSQPREVDNIMDAASFLKQLTARLFSLSREAGTNMSEKMTTYVKNKLLHNYTEFIKEETAYADRLTLALLLHKYFPIATVDKLITRLISEITEWTFLDEDHDLPVFMDDFLEDVTSPSLITELQKAAALFAPAVVNAKHHLDEIYTFLRLLMSKYAVVFSYEMWEVSPFDINQHVSSILNERLMEEVVLITHVSTRDDQHKGLNDIEKSFHDQQLFLAGCGIKTQLDFLPLYEKLG